MNKITVQFDDQQAAALAQACKRARRFSVMELAESGQEADLIVDALSDLRVALRDAGFAPR